MHVGAKAKRDKANLEDTGRRARYEFFDGLVHTGMWIRWRMAHTADDQAETVMGHICGGPGLAGWGNSPLGGTCCAAIARRATGELRAYLKVERNNLVRGRN